MLSPDTLTRLTERPADAKLIGFESLVGANLSDPWASLNRRAAASPDFDGEPLGFMDETANGFRRIEVFYPRGPRAPAAQ